MTRVLIFCATLFINNNIKVVIQMHSFQFNPRILGAPILYSPTIFVNYTVGENIIATIKIQNNYGAIQSFIFPILR